MVQFSSVAQGNRDDSRQLVVGAAPSPQFFVSVASEGFSFGVSRLFATLAGRSISVAAKGVSVRFARGTGMRFSLWLRQREAGRGWRLTITTYITIRVSYLSIKSWGKFASGWRGRG